MSKELPTYPRTVYALTRNFSVRKVTLVKPQSQRWDSGGYTKGGLYFRRHEIFDSHAAAIRAGRSQLKRRKKGLEAGMASLAKQTEALEKAASTEQEKNQ